MPKITTDEARDYFTDPSQIINPDSIPEWVDYYAEGPLCLAFHNALWPGVAMVHIAAKPEGWGRLVGPGQRLRRAYWNDAGPTRIIGWIKDSNRAALSFARRSGFVVDGTFPGVVMMGWTPWV